MRPAFFHRLLVASLAALLASPGAWAMSERCARPLEKSLSAALEGYRSFHGRLPLSIQNDVEAVLRKADRTDWDAVAASASERKKTVEYWRADLEEIAKIRREFQPSLSAHRAAVVSAQREGNDEITRIEREAEDKVKAIVASLDVWETVALGAIAFAQCEGGR